MHKAAERIRNVALVGHRGSGKTSLHEALLFEAGAINRLGSVADGTTVSDADADEQARQMSISAALASFEWQDRKINLLDTPGEPSFVADALGALRVCESAVFVVNAVMGVEVTTARLWQRAARARPRPPDLREHARPRAGRLLPHAGHAQEAFGPHVVATEIPIGSEHEVRGVIDLVDMKAYEYDGDGRENAARSRSPRSSPTQAQEYREKLMDEVAETSDALMERYLEGEEISHEEIVGALKDGHEPRRACSRSPAAWRPATSPPTACSTRSSRTCPRRSSTAAWRSSRASTLEPDEDGGAVRLRLQDARRPVRRAHQPVPRLPGRHERTTRQVLNTRIHSKERIGQLLAFSGKETEHVDEFGPGDIGAVAKLKETRAGDWLGRARRADRHARDQAARRRSWPSRSSRRPRATRTRCSPRCAACRRRTRRSTCTATRRPASRSSPASRRSTSRSSWSA